mmetsp:Transcript_34160/g.55286  ORF Transcript_34160/g.55286 Transcript_34160/m.55286 type:complete len:299 (-) Transcript_34160:169-1065(-)
MARQFQAFVASPVAPVSRFSPVLATSCKASAQTRPFRSAHCGSSFVHGGRNLSFFVAQDYRLQGAQRQSANESGRWTMQRGVTPQVLAFDEKSKQQVWMDVYQALYKKRIIMVAGEIDDEMANQIIAIMLYMDSEKQDRAIQLYINSPGGFVTAGLAVYDTMRHVKSKVATLNFGEAASMASFLLCAGTKGLRYGMASSFVMLHQPSGSATGEMGELQIELDQIVRTRERLYTEYSLMTGQPIEKIVKDLDRDFWLDVDEAREYGVIDKIFKIGMESRVASPSAGPSEEIFGITAKRW